jgi:2,4-dienoyl-CoA reductase-like NADH-dependent reductase (Old Yellow Enzyme family)
VYKKTTGKPTITVGSVTLNNSMVEMMQGFGGSPVDNLDRLLSGFERGECDMVAVGRAMIANPDWLKRVRKGEPLTPYAVDIASDPHLRSISCRLLGQVTAPLDHHATGCLSAAGQRCRGP